MEINLNEIRGNSLVRYGFRVLLAKEFGLYLKEQEVEKILLAESCIDLLMLLDFLSCQIPADILPVEEYM